MKKIQQLNQIAEEVQQNLDSADSLIENGTVIVSDEVKNQVKKARDGWFYAKAIGVGALLIVAFPLVIVVAVVFGKK